MTVEKNRHACTLRGVGAQLFKRLFFIMYFLFLKHAVKKIIIVHRKQKYHDYILYILIFYHALSHYNNNISLWRNDKKTIASTVANAV